jgi:hypothetical protein
MYIIEKDNNNELYNHTDFKCCIIYNRENINLDFLL